MPSIALIFSKPLRPITSPLDFAPDGFLVLLGMAETYHMSLGF